MGLGGMGLGGASPGLDPRNTRPSRRRSRLGIVGLAPGPSCASRSPRRSAQLRTPAAAQPFPRRARAEALAPSAFVDERAPWLQPLPLRERHHPGACPGLHPALRRSRGLWPVATAARCGVRRHGRAGGAVAPTLGPQPAVSGPHDPIPRNRRRSSRGWRRRRRRLGLTPVPLILRRPTPRYPSDVGLHTGKIIHGAIVLDDTDDLQEGASVTVWVEHSQQPVRVSDEEIRLIRQGQAEAARGEGVDARRAFEQLRTGR